MDETDSVYSWRSPGSNYTSVPTSMEPVEKPDDLDGNGHESHLAQW